MDAVLICLAWMNSAVLYRVISRFLASLVERKCHYSYSRKTRLYHCSKQLFIQGRGSGKRVNMCIICADGGPYPPLPKVPPSSECRGRSCTAAPPRASGPDRTERRTRWVQQSWRSAGGTRCVSSGYHLHMSRCSPTTPPSPTCRRTRNKTKQISV